MDENLRNSCRICQSPNQDNDFECLYLDNGFLSMAGQMYEELLDIQIENETPDLYPQYLCNSCELQMRLFKKLKMKAHKTLRLLEKLYAEMYIKPSVNTLIIETEELEETQYLDEANVIQEEECKSQNSLKLFEATTVDFISTDEASVQANNDEDIKVYTETDTIVIETLDDDDDAAQLLNENVDTDEDVESYCSAAEEQTRVVLSNEEDNALHDVALEDDENANYQNNINEKCYTVRKCRKSNKLETKFKCYTCALEFAGRRELTRHRKSIHFNKFMCPQCPKHLQSADSLRVHIQLHEGTPAYKCQLCQKTFNQKVHYNYHMDKHNNVRNFKCVHCDKAFISKSDLSIHMRTHTGDRRYECDICGKDFLIYQHMKMHRYSHLGKSLECEICKQKFTSPSTLYTHVKTIHTNEPQFQCVYCAKKFRRKHHLVTHFKVHQKNKIKNSTEQTEITQAQPLDNNDFMQTICIEDDDEDNENIAIIDKYNEVNSETVNSNNIANNIKDHNDGDIDDDVSNANYSILH